MDDTPAPRSPHEDPSPLPANRPRQPGGGRHVSSGEIPPGLFLGDTEELAAKNRSSGAGQDGTPAAASGPAPEGDNTTRFSSGAGALSTLALLPVTAVALLPFWAVINLVTDLSFWLLFVSYLLIGTALLFRSTQRLMLAAFFDAREPTPRELETLEPAWHAVLDTADVPRDRYVLAVSDSPHIDAVAAGGRIVAVSQLALSMLPPAELEAALAHELGHHLGWHSVSRLAALWLEAPVLLFARLGLWLELLAYGFALLFAWREDFGPAVGALVAGLGVRVATHLVPAALGVAGLVHGIRSLLGRFSTYQADQTAVDLGYGDELIDLLERTVEYRLEGDSNKTAEHLFGGRSLMAKRIERIEAQLDE